MKTIKLKFTGFWPEFDEKNNFIVNAIRDKFNIIYSNEPDYVISSCFSDEYLKYDCVRLFYTGENLCPDFNAFDYAIGYEYLNYGDRYYRFPNYLIPEVYGHDYELMLNKNNIGSEEELSSRKFCSFVVSKGSGYVDKRREELFELLSGYQKVDSGGRYLNNIGIPKGVSNKLDFQSKYKFSIACENSLHSGYSTEKIVQAFAAKTVPIYWGDPDIGKVFNEQAFINCFKYKSFSDVLEKVKEVNEDDSQYLEMLRAPALKITRSQEEINMQLSDFLCHIFIQDKHEAIRRDTVGYGKMHCDKLEKYQLIEKSLISKILNKMTLK